MFSVYADHTLELGCLCFEVVGIHADNDKASNSNKKLNIVTLLVMMAHSIDYNYIILIVIYMTGFESHTP